MELNDRKLYEFDEFRFDAEKRVLWRDKEIVALTPKAAEVLLLILENHGNLVERDKILEKVWPGTFVEEGNLNHAISALRKTLGNNEIIQTIPRRGYRFAGKVREIYDSDRSDLMIERRTISQTVIEERELTEENKNAARRILPGAKRNLFPLVVAALALALLLVGATLYFRRSPTAAEKNVKTIAILPLQSLNNDDESNVLKLGIIENLASRLGNLERLVVRPLDSVKKVSETEADPLEAGKKLKTDIILVGSYQRADGRIRLTVRLLNVVDGSQVWAGSFDEVEQDIFKLQDSLSAQAAKSLVERLTPREERQLVSRPTENLEAYKLYLTGRYFWNQRAVESYLKAIDFFRQSIALDPNFALGYSGIADCYTLLEQRGGLPAGEAIPKAEEAARKALELDETLAETHASMGLIKALYQWDWKGAENHYRRAIELNPNYATAYGSYGMNLLCEKRFEESERLLKKAEQLDPTSRSIAIYLAWNYYFGRQFDRAVEQGRRALELDANLTTPYMILRASFEQKGMYEEAVDAELTRIRNSNPRIIEELSEAYRKAGIKGFWEKQIEIAQKYPHSGGEIAGYHLATRFALLGRSEEALNEIEKGFAERGSMWHMISVDPVYDSLRDEPRFKELLGRLKIPE
jgi:DNA-binding winged helix-turn-helix (wHTH) protein/TolB-like protein